MGSDYLFETFFQRPAFRSRVVDLIYERERAQYPNVQGEYVNYLAGQHEIRAFTAIQPIKNAASDKFIGVFFIVTFIIADSKTAKSAYVITGHSPNPAQARWLTDRIKATAWLDDWKPTIPVRPGEVLEPAALPNH